MCAGLAMMIATACSTNDDSFRDSDSYYTDNMDGDLPESEAGGKFDEFKDNPFIKTSTQETSTFSIDADGASYGIMRRFITSGTLPPSKGSVRIEELLNYFTFDYPEPVDGQTVGFNYEMAVCPWNTEHRLLRIGLKGKSLEASESPKANYVFLVDVSGSMDSDDKIELLKKCLITLTDYLKPTDRISIITYAGEVNKLLESTPVSEKETIKAAISKLRAGGCTNGGSALQMAYDEARKNYIEGGNNRIILGTDGDFNVGVTSTDALVEMVESNAKSGIYLTTCGFGLGNLNDSMMEKIADKGNGNYEYIDCEDQMTKVFVNEISRFTAVANDTKIQIVFDKDAVDSYRLIGYENRVLNKEDFDNDKKDAGEIGAGQTITALYEIIPSDRFAKDMKCATASVRYKKTLGADSGELGYEIDGSDLTPQSDNMNFAAAVAAYGMILRGSEYKGNADFKMVQELAAKGLKYDPHGYRKAFIELAKKASDIYSANQHYN
jgi:Ca-activated chloride channel family protein